MSEFQDRVVLEHEELEHKIKKLAYFINNSSVFAGLQATDQTMLVMQLEKMKGYSSILSMRISRFA